MSALLLQGDPTTNIIFVQKAEQAHAAERINLSERIRRLEIDNKAKDEEICALREDVTHEREEKS